LRQARSILRHSRALAESIIKGTALFDDALQTVRAQEQEANSAEGQLERLRGTAPDLATRVADENITLDEAYALLKKREVELNNAREAGRRAMENVTVFAAHVTSMHSAIEAGEKLVFKPRDVSLISDAYQLFMKISSFRERPEP
jgi:hypothetical protein